MAATSQTISQKITEFMLVRGESIAMTIRGLEIHGEILQMLLGAKYAEYMKKFRYVYVPKKGPPKAAISYSSDGPRLILPRTQYSKFAKIFNIIICWPALPPSVDIKLLVPLMPMQQIIFTELAKTFCRESIMGAQVLDLRPGYGKTYIAAALIAHLGVRTALIVANSALEIQAAKDFEAALGPAWNNIVDIIIINTARKTDFSAYHFVIYDEIHAYPTAENSKVFFRANVRFVLGLSGTVAHRRDGWDRIYYDLVATPLAATSIAGFAYDDINFRVHVRLVAYCGAPEFTEVKTHESTGGPFTPFMIKDLCEDPMRRELFLRELAALYAYRDGSMVHNIFVFCEEKAPIEPLIEAAVLRLGIAPELIGNFIGGTSEKTQKEIRANCRIIFTTYAFSSKGISIERMTAMILLTPRRANAIQLYGRIQRRGSDEKIPRVIVDIWDKINFVWRAQLKDRRVGYEFYGAKIEKIKYADLDYVRPRD